MKKIIRVIFLISIIYVYNDESILEEFLLKSLKRQTVEFELILINNTSGRFKSAAKALNHGGNRANGDYIMFLHQLGYHLRNDMGLDAYMFYQPPDYPNPIHKEYKMYRVPYVDEVEDNRKNLIIAPEVSLMKVMDDYKRIRKIIWWLSVDNFYISKFSKESPFRSYFYNRVNSFAYLVLNMEIFDVPKIVMNHYKNYNLKNDKTVLSADLHLAQSYYALKHLKDHGFENVAYLSDYLNEEFLKKEPDLNKKKGTSCI